MFGASADSIDEAVQTEMLAVRPNDTNHSLRRLTRAVARTASIDTDSPAVDVLTNKIMVFDEHNTALDDAVNGI